MAFTFAALTYILAIIIDAFLIFFAIFHVSKEISVPGMYDCDVSEILFIFVLFR